MRFPRRLSLIVLVLAARLFYPDRVEADPYYAITNLGQLWPSAINDAGQVVGTNNMTNNVGEYGWIYNSYGPNDGVVQPLAGSPNNSSAAAINDSGAVVGTLNDQQGVIWEPYGTTVTLNSGNASSPYTASITVTAINNNGQVVGMAPLEPWIPGVPFQAAIWTDGSQTNLGALTSTGFSWAAAVNDSGQVVGWSYSPTYPSGEPQHDAVLWSHGQIIDLGVLGKYVNSEATSINNNGQVVGEGTASDGTSHGFLYQNGTLTDFGPNTVLNGINNAGQMIGTANLTQGFLYQNGQITYLSSLISPGSGWTDLTPKAINNQGQILGEGWDNGVAESFILTPSGLPVPAAVGPLPTLTPEPGTLIGFAFLLCAMGIRQALRPKTLPGQLPGLPGD